MKSFEITSQEADRYMNAEITEREYIEDEEDDSIKASMLILINQENNINIQFSWDGENSTSEAMGALLYDMNIGNLTNLIMNILLEKITAEPENEEFIQSIILNWQLFLRKRQEMLNTPAVPPHKTFGASRIS